MWWCVFLLQIKHILSKVFKPPDVDNYLTRNWQRSSAKTENAECKIYFSKISFHFKKTAVNLQLTQTTTTTTRQSFRRRQDTKAPFLLLWLWPWLDDIDMWNWPRYSELRCTYIPENELFRSRLSKVRALKTDRQRDKCDWKRYHAAFSNSNNNTQIQLEVSKCSTTEILTSVRLAAPPQWSKRMRR